MASLWVNAWVPRATGVQPILFWLRSVANLTAEGKAYTNDYQTSRRVHHTVHVREHTVHYLTQVDRLKKGIRKKSITDLKMFIPREEGKIREHANMSGRLEWGK